MVDPSAPRRDAAVAQALLVTLLWSSSWVLIKIGLGDLSPLVFAGLRYGLAALLLLPGALVVLRRRGLAATAGPGGWPSLLVLGVVMYSLTQGAQFAALALLPAATLALVLNMTPLLVALASWPVLRERPTRLQVVGAGLVVVGAVLYLGPGASAGGSALGLAVAVLGLVANATAALLGRRINRERSHPLVVTGVSMAFGAPLLLTVGLVVEGWPALDLEAVAIIAWLAVVNTAFAFTLWNRTLRVLSATESSVINNTMLIQVAVLAWLFLGEALTPVEVGGLVTAGVGALAVQLRR